MKLTPYIAQSIVNRTMKLLTYNINIMNEQGIIIGSGNSRRLNIYHQGADKVLKENIPIAIRKENLDNYQGCQEGLNLPICFNEKPVGVVGITGDPEEIKIYGGLVQAMAELMLEENFYWERMNAEDQARFSLINDLIRHEPEGSEDLLSVRAELLGYKLDVTRATIVFEIIGQGDKGGQSGIISANPRLSSDSFERDIYDPRVRRKIKNILDELPLGTQDLFASGIKEKYVLLKSVEDGEHGDIRNFIGTLVERFQQGNVQITVGVGSTCQSFVQIPDSFAEALQSLEIGSKLYGKGRVYYTEELGLENIISRMGEDSRKNYAHSILNKLMADPNSANQRLLETALAYLDCDLKLKETAQKIFVHRNTLTYRILKIKEKTGLDLNKLDHALKFKLATMCWKYDHGNICENAQQ